MDAKKGIGVLSKKVEISVQLMTGLEQNPFLGPEGVISLTAINQFAREFFEGIHGLTDNGHLIPFPEEKKELPYPCGRLFLDVKECAIGLLNLQKLLGRSPLERRLFKNIEGLSLQGLHLHRTDGTTVEVSKGKFGVVLSG